MKKGETKDEALSAADAEAAAVVKQALAATADLPDIPSDFHDMSSEDWTALNDWLRKAHGIFSTGPRQPLPPDGLQAGMVEDDLP